MFSQDELSDSQDNGPINYPSTNPFRANSSNPFAPSLNPFDLDSQIDGSGSQQVEPATETCAAASSTTKKRKLEPELELEGIESKDAELKEIIERMQNLILSKINALEVENKEMMKALEKKIDVIARNTARQNSCIDELVAATRPRVGLHSRDEVFSSINSKEELEKFEVDLKETNYKEKIMHWLQSQVTRVDVENRLHDTIDLIFTRSFFASMNWTGISKTPGVNKIGLSHFKNIVRLFVDIGSNNSVVLDEKFVGQFLIRKLSHARDRINISDSKQTSCHVMKRQ